MTRTARTGAAGAAAARMTLGFAAVSLTAAALSACAVGPNFVPPAAPPVSRYTKEPLRNPSAADAVRTRQGGSADQSFVSGADIPAEWWKLFHSKALNRLVEQALANNPNLENRKAALARNPRARERSRDEAKAQPRRKAS